MPYCQNCGSFVNENQEVCFECGTQIKKTASTARTTSYSSDDTGGFGWGLLGFCIPVAGLILFIVWNTEKPNNARAAGTGALISVILSFIFGLLFGLSGF